MSVGVERVDDVLLQAVNNTISKFGIPIVTAAGNAGSDSCLNSPARSVLAVSVGSLDQFDNKTDFSNFGRCVDGYVPGDKVKGASIGRRDLYTTMSGTSMSAPLVTGIAGQLLQAKPNTTWNDIKDYLASGYYRNPDTLRRVLQAPPLTRILAQKYHTTDICSVLLEKPNQQVQVTLQKDPGAMPGVLPPSQMVTFPNPGKVSVSLTKVPAPAPARLAG